MPDDRPLDAAARRYRLKTALQYLECGHLLNCRRVLTIDLSPDVAATFPGVAALEAAHHLGGWDAVVELITAWAVQVWGVE